MYLGIRNPLMIIGHFSVKPTGKSNGWKDLAFDVFHVTETTLCVLTLCEKTVSVNKTAGMTKWTEESTAYGNVVISSVLATPRSKETDTNQVVCWQAEHADSDPVSLNDDLT